VNKESAKVQQFVYLPGGVSATLDAAATSRTWSFPNLHGHVTATSNDNGDRLTSVVNDPWGVALNPAPNNVSGTADLGAYGGNGKLTESTTTKAVTHMGARPYTASTARFLTVDPIHGGCANHYVYGFGDPINAQDLTGKGIFDWVGDKIDGAWDATGGKVVSWVKCNPLAAVSIGLGVVGLGLLAAPLVVGSAAWVGVAGQAVGVASTALGVYNVVQGARSGNNEKMVWGAVGVGAGVIGLGLGAVGKVASGAFAGPATAYSASLGVYSAGVEIGTSRSSC
jgi:RHS repeat-associated protein